RESVYANDCARGRILREIIGESFIQFSVVTRILQVDLGVHAVVFRKSRRFDHRSDLFKALANLTGELFRSAALRTARPLSGDVHIVPGIDSAGAQPISGARNRRLQNASRLGMETGGGER